MMMVPIGARIVLCAARNQPKRVQLPKYIALVRVVTEGQQISRRLSATHTNYWPPTYFSCMYYRPVTNI